MDDVFTTSARTNGQASLVVDQSMIEEIKIEDKKYSYCSSKLYCWSY